MTTSSPYVKKDYLLHNQSLCVVFQVLFSVDTCKKFQGDWSYTRSTLYRCFQIYVCIYYIYINTLLHLYIINMIYIYIYIYIVCNILVLIFIQPSYRQFTSSFYTG